jgi:transposase InsO family protein
VLGKRKLADVLARAGLVLAASTIARLKKRPLPPPPAPAKKIDAPAQQQPATPAQTPTDEAVVPEHVVTAKYPHHLWHVDFTTVSTCAGAFLPWWPFALFSLWPFCWHLALVVDHFSRSLVAFAVFKKEPTGRQLSRFLDRAVAAAGKAPRHVVSDRGSQFQSEYLDWCTKNDAKPRFGAIGKHGSIAVIERFIRSIKREHLRRILVPFRRRRLVEHIADYQSWFNDHRPHDALAGLTPSEKLAGSAAPRRRFEPRERYPIPNGDEDVRRCANLELVVSHAHGQPHLPIVELRAAA